MAKIKAGQIWRCQDRHHWSDWRVVDKKDWWWGVCIAASQDLSHKVRDQATPITLSEERNDWRLIDGWFALCASCDETATEDDYLCSKCRL